ncbi:hypothetical protein GCM10010211_38150 [Streptomyces albospinus]|uniref:Uncharacterized protein n=1 Tax=Streptomyces albospinus TaxID=285515 RepID=A0ABQ2V550_9ACTN|nr:hypothetical protein GCM10010211_38150 [Streptomyces albospinus]
MSTIQRSWDGVGWRALAAILGMARFIAATSDCATRTQAHTAAVTERRPAREPAAADRGAPAPAVGLPAVEPSAVRGAVVEGPADRARPVGGRGADEVMAGTLESRLVDLNCKVCTA